MQHLITLACLIAALASDIVGWGQSVTGFVVAGMFLEGLFWLRLLRNKKQSSPAKTGL